MNCNDVDEVSEATASAFAKMGHLRQFERGAVICRQGDPSGPVMLVVRGRIEIRTPVDDTDIVVGSVGIGRLVGEIASIDGSVRTATLVAATAVTLHEVDPLTFADLLESEPSVALDVLRSVVARFRAEPTSLPSLSRDARALGTALVDLLDHSGVPWGLVSVAQVTPHALAAGSGFELDRMASALDELERGGLVHSEPTRVAVEDRHTLERICRGAQP